MNRITIDPEQCGGRPCIRGMRIRVIDVLDLLGNGLTPEQVLEELPDLEADDINACLLSIDEEQALRDLGGFEHCRTIADAILRSRPFAEDQVDPYHGPRIARSAVALAASGVSRPPWGGVLWRAESRMSDVPGQN